MDRNNLLLIN